MKLYRSAIRILIATIVGLGLTPRDLRAGEDSTHDVFLVSIKVRETKANGSSWDPAGGKPDLRVIISNERSGKTFVSTLAKDTTAVQFELKAPVLDVSDGDILDVLVYDEDLADHDIVGISRKAITTGILAKKELDLSFGQVEQLRMELQPRKKRSEGAS